MNFAIIAQQLVSGMGSSLMIFVLTLLFSMPLGLLVAFGRMSKIKPLQAVIKVFIAIFAQMVPLRCDYHRLFY